eukprot:991210-Rhodomonas_salina.5
MMNTAEGLREINSRKPRFRYIWSGIAFDFALQSCASKMPYTLLITYRSRAPGYPLLYKRQGDIGMLTLPNQLQISQKTDHLYCKCDEMRLVSPLGASGYICTALGVQHAH